MRARTAKNRAPPWPLTELAVKKGKELAARHRADSRLVVAALYLAHTVFDETPRSETQRDHVRLSAAFAEQRLIEWDVPARERAIILNAIRAHHAKEPMQSKEAEVVRNAECFKFLSVDAASAFLDDLARRGMSRADAVAYFREKIAQKRALLTFEECMREADANIREIERRFLS